MIPKFVSNLLSGGWESALGITRRGNASLFNEIIGYEGIKRTFLRSLNSEEPVHILLVEPPGHAKTLFLKCIFEKFGQNEAFFTWVVMLANQVL